MFNKWQQPPQDGGLANDKAGEVVKFYPLCGRIAYYDPCPEYVIEEISEVLSTER